MFKQRLEQRFLRQKMMLIALWIFIVAGGLLGLSLCIKFDIEHNSSYTSHKF